jgi:pimeloyl-ACP methyl ester carboxylesterase
LAGELPNAKLEMITDCGHLPHEEQPQVFMKVVSDFIKEIHL